jgi:hypothetical protein
MTDDEIERAKDELEDLRGEVRQVLADELGADTGGYRADRVEAARAVVYDDDGELIPPEELADALEAAGVTVSVGDDGIPEYSDVPPSLSLSACHLAVDLRKDPAEIVGEPSHAVADAGERGP